jgi:hypothetical protein
MQSPPQYTGSLVFVCCQTTLTFALSHMEVDLGGTPRHDVSCLTGPYHKYLIPYIGEAFIFLTHHHILQSSVVVLHRQSGNYCDMSWIRIHLHLAVPKCPYAARTSLVL